MRLLQYPNLRDSLTQLAEQLERCQKALSDYLEDKRERFPRFYFIGDEDLLEILGQAKNPQVIQNHLKKLFSGIHSVEFSEDIQRIVAIRSADGEIVHLCEAVPISGEVESWLSKLVVTVERTLQQLLKQCMAGFDGMLYK
jgi:dynein heavy chain 2